jgi:alpha-L-rhamnosidase
VVEGTLSAGRFSFVADNFLTKPLPMKFWGSLNLREYLAVGEPMGRALLRLEYLPDTPGGLPVVQEVVSDLSWLAGNGSIVQNNIYLGETVDARRVKNNWSAPRYLITPAEWSPVVDAGGQLPPSSTSSVQQESVPPTLVVESYSATRLWEVSADRSRAKTGRATVFDAGKNSAAGVTLFVPGRTPRGMRIRVLYGEILWPNASVNPLTAVAGQIKHAGEGGPCCPAVAVQEDVFVCRGSTGGETFETTFTWHGFRYAEVTVENGQLSSGWRPEFFTVRRLSTDVQDAGSFHSSDPLLNQINEMVRNSVRSNLGSGLQSDCPTRERFGYGGDVFATAASVSQHFDTLQLYSKRVRDFAAALRPNGGVTETAPYNGLDSSGLGDESGPIGWGTAFLDLQLLVWRNSRDERLVFEMFPHTRRWIALLRSVAEKNGGVIPVGLGDWSSIDQRDVAFTSTSFLLYNLNVGASLATIAGEHRVAIEWEKAADSTRATLASRFSNCTHSAPFCGKFAGGTQCDQSFALRFGVPQSNDEEKRAFNLLLDAVNRAGSHFHTGIFGTPYMLEALTSRGHEHVAHRLVTQTGYPSYDFMLSKNATSLWEVWEWSDSTYSHNHAMFGAVTEWFFSLGGIRPMGAEIVPVLLPYSLLKSVNTTLDTVLGLFESHWAWHSPSEAVLEVSVPLNCRSTLVLPDGSRKLLGPGIHRFRIGGNDAKKVQTQKS